MVLVSPEQGRSVRVSGAADDLLPLLVDGATFDDLARRLQDRHPQAADVHTKLSQFLGQLDRACLMDAATPARARRAPKRFASFDADPPARWLAERVLRLPGGLTWGLLGFAGAGALLALAALIWAGRVPHPSVLFSQFSLWGLLLFVAVVVPSHELAHALACRLSGVAVGNAGLLLHGGLLPGPYVNTTQMYQVARRAPRFWVAAAGPLVDALGLGAAAAWLLLNPAGDAPMVAAASTLFLLCAAFLFLDTNPITPSDGSHMVEALLGDELARRSALTRRRARMSTAKTVAWYRIACSLHLQGSVVLLYFWWTLAPR
jgi:hypothetical protein